MKLKDILYEKYKADPKKVRAMRKSGTRGTALDIPKKFDDAKKQREYKARVKKFMKQSIALQYETALYKGSKKKIKEFSELNWTGHQDYADEHVILGQYNTANEIEGIWIHLGHVQPGEKHFWFSQYIDEQAEDPEWKPNFAELEIQATIIVANNTDGGDWTTEEVINSVSELSILDDILDNEIEIQNKQK